MAQRLRRAAYNRDPAGRHSIGPLLPGHARGLSPLRWSADRCVCVRVRDRLAPQNGDECPGQHEGTEGNRRLTPGAADNHQSDPDDATEQETEEHTDHESTPPQPAEVEAENTRQ